MNKFDDLQARRSAAMADVAQVREGIIDELNEIDVKHKVELDEIQKAVDKMFAEFERKVKSPFRGVHISTQLEEDLFVVYIGEQDGEVHEQGLLRVQAVDRIAVLTYRSTIYCFNESYITRATADKIKALYIEYFGEL